MTDDRHRARRTRYGPRLTWTLIFLAAALLALASAAHATTDQDGRCRTVHHFDLTP